jgi:hypothetical protein
MPEKYIFVEASAVETSVQEMLYFILPNPHHSKHYNCQTIVQNAPYTSFVFANFDYHPH